jgi:hypothetical protein
VKIKNSKSIFLPQEDKSDSTSKELLARPAILENVTGAQSGAKRVLYSLAEVPAASTDKGSDSYVVVTIHETNGTNFVLEPGERLKIDKIRGTASFTSRDVRYKIRPMNKDEVAFLASSISTGAAKKPEEK